MGWRGFSTIVCFYPRDGTPGCTIETRQFQAHLDGFEAAGATVYGGSTDSVERHAAFVLDEDNYVQRITFVLVLVVRGRDRFRIRP